MKTKIRVALTADGDIEAAATYDPTWRVVIDRRTGEVKTATVLEGFELFRALVRAARKEMNQPDRREMT